MDARLFGASEAGDLNLLRQLLQENPLILESVWLNSATNPLHVASTAGKVEFVKEMMMLKPEFAKEMDQNGYSPLHVAAANGHLEVVRELIRSDRKLCCIQGRDEKTPLHLASVKGRVDTMAEMLLACPESIGSTTIQGETPLHLAVKNNQISAVRVLVDWILDVNKDHVLNIMDELGNTALHLATWKKQRQVIQILVRDKTISSGLLDVNAINHSGLTALDLLLIFPSEAGDREIGDILRRAGAMRARETNLFCPITSANTEGDSDPPFTCLLEPDNLVEYFKFKMGRDSPSEARGPLLVIAVLVATATFQVGLSPPSGIWQDSYFPDRTNNTLVGKKHLAGWSILGTSSETSFLLFVLFNTVAFSMSLHMIGIMTGKFPFQFELALCMMGMFFSYNTAMINMSPDSVKLQVIVVTSLLNLLTLQLFSLLRKQLLRMLLALLRRGHD